MIVKEEDTVIFSGQAVQETFTEGIQEEDHLKSAKAKMDEVAEENKKLKLTLSQMMKNYQSLKMSFDGIFKQDDHPIKFKGSFPKLDESEEKSELVCRLSLGSISGEDGKKQEKKINQDNQHLKELVKADGLELGLDHKFHLCDSGDVTKNHPSSKNNSLDESKEEEIEAKGSIKSLKSARSATSDEILELNPVIKKPRVSVRAVCDTQTMNDGCQWRKYGQKVAKGNPCPRAYYRCTASSSCPVRKQVQRCADNMAILITTYEGTHNHPLPPSATTMASATTSAAAMLNCGSSTSSPPSIGVFSTSSATASNFNTFNFSSSKNTLTSPYTFPRASIATSQSHPTVILDLTPPNHTSIPNNKYSHSSSLFSSTPGSSSTCLNFSSVPHSDSGSLGIYKTLFHTEIHASSYSQPCAYNKNIQEDILSVDGIGAAAKAITRDPKFQTALATAVASLLGNGSGVNNIQESNSGQNLRLGESFGLSFSQPSSRYGVTACATSYLSKYLESLNPQHK
ncbi:WRKY transcription factor 72A-like isoform X2 [Primulina huaijiensis]|uniref:WRKY transcription factor 72A-like isoform X2 n=1 Tax=Primulina huaijiensis TaxID=1492673 RepID=UPI003CC77AE0